MTALTVSSLCFRVSRTLLRASWIETSKYASGGYYDLPHNSAPDRKCITQVYKIYKKKPSCR